MQIYIDILEQALNNINEKIKDLDIDDLEELVSTIRLTEFSNSLISETLFFIERNSMDEENQNQLLLQQIKSKLVLGERKLKELEKLENDFYFDWE